METAELRAAARIGAAARSTGRPVVVHTMYPRGRAATALREAGVPVYESVEQASGALRRLAAQGAHGAHGIRHLSGIPELGDRALPVTGDGYEAARALLAAAGVPLVEQRTVTTLAEALAAAGQIGYPVVLKALGRLHKSDAGGVVTAIADDGELAAAFTNVADRLAPERCSLERMAPLADGIELLIGTRWDTRFGPVALAGAGGVYAEILRDTAVALAPVNAEQAEAMLRSLRAAPLLAGARGRPALDVGAAAQALAAVSRAAAAHPELTELEVNPLLVTRAGALALDARFVRSPIPTEETPCSSPTPRSSTPCATAPAA
jgi:acyl-CoA synthetase (NDP forming)